MEVTGTWSGREKYALSERYGKYDRKGESSTSVSSSSLRTLPYNSGRYIFDLFINQAYLICTLEAPLEFLVLESPPYTQTPRHRVYGFSQSGQEN